LSDVVLKSSSLSYLVSEFEEKKSEHFLPTGSRKRRIRQDQASKLGNALTQSEKIVYHKKEGKSLA
jgi:hypothetical protein